MFSKTIETSNGKLKITIPSDRSEITLGMLEDLTPALGHSFSPLEMLSRLSGIPTGDKEFDGKEVDLDEATLQDIHNLVDLEVFDEPMQLLAYQLKAFAEVQEIPEKIEIKVNESHSKKWFNRRGCSNIKTVMVLKNLGIAPAGAYMEAKELIKEEYERYDKVKELYPDLNLEFTPSVAAQIRLLSLYFYVPATGEKFTSQRAADFDQVIRKLPITKALPIARYFFLRYPNLSKEKVTPSLASLKLLRSMRG